MRSGSKLLRTVAALERLGCAVAVRYAGERGAGLEELARSTAPDFDAVIAAGGDGTVDAVVNGLFAGASGTMPVLGVLPLGTVNLLARELGVPRDPGALAAAIVSAPVRSVWPGRIGDRLFMVVVGCGFDAETVAAVDPALKLRLGRTAFLPALLKTLRQECRRALALCIDGVEESANSVIIAKGRYYAGPFVLAPAATIAEPYLHAVLLRSGGRRAMVRCLAAGVCGALNRLRDVEIRRCKTVSIAGNDAAPVQADGEIVAALPVTVGVADRPLHLIWP